MYGKTETIANNVKDSAIISVVINIDQPLRPELVIFFSEISSDTNEDKKKNLSTYSNNHLYLFEEKIIFFLEKCSESTSDKYHRLEPDLLQRLWQHFSELKPTTQWLQEHSMSQSKINKFYAATFNMLSAAKNGANKKNKPLLILFGENHYSHQSRFLELTVYSAAKIQGLSAIGVELSSKKLLEEKGISNRICDLTSTTNHYLQKQASLAEIPIVPLEGGWQSDLFFLLYVNEHTKKIYLFFHSGGLIWKNYL